MSKNAMTPLIYQRPTWLVQRSDCKRTLWVFLWLIALLMLLDGRSVSAQTNIDAAAHPLMTADTSSPQATLESFIEACKEMHRLFHGEGRSFRTEAERQAVASRALRCLNLEEVPASMRISASREAAICLKEVLDRIDLPAEDTWPNSDAVEKKEITRWQIPNTEIIISQVKEGPREGEFLFSPQTVDRATDFYDLVKHLPYKERDEVTPGFYLVALSEPGWMIPHSWIQSMPTWAYARWFGQAIWQWLALIITLLSAILVMLAIYILGRRRERLLRSNVLRYLITLTFPLAAMFIPLATLYFIRDHIHISGTAIFVTDIVLRLVFLFALIVVLLGAGSRLAAIVIATPWIQPRSLDAQLVRLICRVVSILAATIVFLEGGRQFGIPITTLLASAGVGGLAVALAAQDTLKNVFGSVMITLDKPYKVGERIVAKGYDGFVEEIGLRSTKIRLLTGHQVSIPNEEMARSDIENIGRRPNIRRTASLQMPSYTPVAKVRRALEIVRNVLENHDGMDNEFPPRVYLRDINDASIGIFLIYWYHPPDYWEYLAFSEKLNLQIMEQFEAEQIPFARPGLMIHMAERQEDIPSNRD